MKKHLFIFCLAATITLSFSCNNAIKKADETGVDVDLEDAIAQAESRRSADPDAEGGNKCLLEFAENYDQLLTEAMAIELTGFSKENMEVKHSNSSKNTAYNYISYRFTNKRIGKIMDYEGQVRDQISIASIKPMSLNQFKSAYRIISKEEQADADKVLDDVSSGNSDSEEANKKIEDLEKQGVDKKTTKGITDIMKDSFKNINKSYVTINDFADSASWNSLTKELHVIKDGVHFQIMSDVSNDDAVNKKLALATAQKILEKCK